MLRALVPLLGVVLIFCGDPSTDRPRFESPPTFQTLPQFESLPTFLASKILPPDLLAGPDHHVAEQVVNDGFMNIYTINSRFGTFTANSDAELRIRVGEVKSIARMEDLAESEQFARGVGKAGLDALETTAHLITDPVDTVEDTASGVKEMFQSVRGGVESLAGRLGDKEGVNIEDIKDLEDIVDLEDIGDMIGYSRARRQYAVAFGVDPYSTNPVLQEHLTRLSLAGFVGHFAARTGLGFIDGGVGTAISVVNNLDSLRRTVEDQSPEELSGINGKKLLAMEVPQTVVDLFLGNTAFSPTYQTAFVTNLEEVDGAADRAAFVKAAVLAKNEDQVLFRVHQARMYANYHESVAPIQAFAQVTKMVVVAARTADGTVVVNGPLDYVSLTSNLAGYFEAARSGLEDMPDVSGKEVWIAGGMSPTARKWVEESGWDVYTNAREQLLPES
jgi:hypothetical protein